MAAVAVIAGCGRLGFDGVDGAVGEGDARCPFRLCEDFDGPPFAQWDMVLGSPNIDIAMSVSPPGSMTVTRADVRADGTAFLEKAFAGGWAELDCSWSFRFDHQSPMEIVFIVVEFAEGNRPGYGVSIHVGDGAATFFEGYDTMVGRLVTNVPLSSGPLRAQWGRVGVAMSPLGASAVAKITLDGELVGQKVLDQAATITGASLRLGSTYAPGTSPFDLRYDDVSCDLR
jgi:hypothetical protein